MKINLPIDLTLTTMTNKVSVGAQERMRQLAKKNRWKMQDVLSACLLHMPEENLARIMDEQKKAVDALPKHMQAMLKNLDKLSDEERAMLKDVL